MKTTNDIFKGSDASLTEVIILPVGSHGAGSYSLPTGDMWTDYESVEFIGQYLGTHQVVDTLVLTKEYLLSYPTTWVGRLVGTSSSNHTIDLNCTGINTFSIATAVGSIEVSQVKAYKKKYTTRNLSKVVSVNGGADIAVNQRHEIDIASMLGSEYLNRDLIVKVEIYASGTNYTGWAEIDLDIFHITSTYYSNGVGVYVTGSSITVLTAQNLIVDHNTRNIWGLSANITSAPCRIKVWKVDEYLPATRSSGDITTIWTGSAGTGVTVDWSGTGYVLSQFDAITFEFISTEPLRRAAMTLTSDTLLSIGAAELVRFYVTGSNLVNVQLDSINETSLVTNSQAVGYTGGGVITGIYGINYK